MLKWSDLFSDDIKAPSTSWAESNPGAIIGGVIAAVIIIAVVIGVVIVYIKKKRKGKYNYILYVKHYFFLLQIRWIIHDEIV